MFLPVTLMLETFRDYFNRFRSSVVSPPHFGVRAKFRLRKPGPSLLDFLFILFVNALPLWRTRVLFLL